MVSIVAVMRTRRGNSNGNGTTERQYGNGCGNGYESTERNAGNKALSSDQSAKLNSIKPVAGE